MNIKKIVISISIVLLSLSMVKAQENKTTNNTGSIDTSLSNDVLSMVSPGTMEDIYKIHLNYCNKDIQGNTVNSYMTINMRPGQSKDLCISFVNTTEKYQDLTIGFTESIKNAIGKQLCNGDLNDKNNAFYQLIDLPYTNIGLSGNDGTFTQIARLKIPKNATGDIYGCIGFLLSGAFFKGPGDVLGVRVARHFPLKINITGDVYTLGRRDASKDFYTINKNPIFRVIIGILAIWLIITIVQTSKKREKHAKKK